MHQATIRKAVEVEHLFPTVIEQLVAEYATLTRKEKVDHYLENNKGDIQWRPRVGSMSYAMERNAGPGTLLRGHGAIFSDCLILQENRDQYKTTRRSHFFNLQPVTNEHVRECLLACDGTPEWAAHEVLFCPYGGIGMFISRAQRIWFRLPTDIIPLLDLECQLFATPAEKSQLLSDCFAEWNTIVDQFLEEQLL